VEDSFPQEEGKENRSRKLWRLDPLGEKSYLLVVSEEKPDLGRLEKYGVEGSAETKDYSSYLNRIEAGKVYRFRVVLNPVHSVSQGEGKRGRVYPEITVAKQMEFLEKRAEKYGFRLLEDQYRITDRHYDILRKAGMRQVHLCVVAYEGKLEVTDVDQFRDTLIHGIGKKKAYGCGMMTVIPEIK